MRRLTAIFAVCAALLVTSACGGSSGGGGGSDIQALVQGTWAGCTEDRFGISFTQTTLVVSGTSYNFTFTTHDNSTCAGTGVPYGTQTGTFAIVSAVTAGLGGTSVTAYRLNASGSLVYPTAFSPYDLLYVDTAATPDRLYTGASNPYGNNGTTPALRPITLDTSSVLTKV